MAECVIWQKSVDKDGYGVQRRGGVQGRAHRWAWKDSFGDIPKGMCVLHKCDNPKCINPDHLFLGTQADNQRDMRSKNRNYVVKGGECPWAKLTKENVNFIRQSDLRTTDLANMFGVGWVTVYNARTGKSWQHLH